MPFNLVHYDSNTEALPGCGPADRLRVHDVILNGPRGKFTMRIGIFDIDGFFVSHKSLQDGPGDLGARSDEDSTTLDMEDYFSRLGTGEVVTHLTPAAQDYVIAVTGLSATEVQHALWPDILNGTFEDRSIENEAKTLLHWDKNALEHALNHRVLFGRSDRQRQYNHTRFLSKFIYDVDLSKYSANNETGFLQQLVGMAQRSDSYSEIICLASLCQTAGITSIEVFKPLDTNMCLKLTGSVAGRPTVYWAFKGTVAKELPGYLFAYGKLHFSPERQVSAIVESIKKAPAAAHLVCGHSYGAWLADEVLRRTEANDVTAFLYNPPWTVEQRHAAQTGVTFDSGYRAYANTRVFMQTHIDDPVSYPSARTFFKLGAHASSKARHDPRLIDLPSAERPDGLNSRASFGLDAFPMLSFLVQDLERERGVPKMEALRDLVGAHLHDVDALFSHPGFLRYLSTRPYPVQDLHAEATQVQRLFSRMMVVQQPSTPEPVPAMAEVAMTTTAIAKSGWLSRIRMWIAGSTEVEHVASNSPTPGMN